MTKESLLVLCASLCLSFGLPLTGEAQSHAPKSKEVRKASTVRTATDSLGGEHHPLLADRLEIKKKISAEKKQREQQLAAELAEESYHNPAIDLYGEDSWTSHVNPFTSAVEIPTRYDIDINDFVMPLERRQVTSHYGYRSRFGRMHYGTDLALSVGDTIKASFSGKVRISSYEGRGYGNYIVIRHPNGLETVYGHLHRRFVQEGTIIKAGDPIGLGGNTGRSTGPHLHFEARFMGIPLNPHDLFDFEEGVPREDVYTFRRGTRPSTYAHTSKAQATTGGTAPKTHRVKKGETLFSIAQKYGTTVNKLRTLNGLANNRVKVNKTIRVS